MEDKYSEAIRDVSKKYPIGSKVVVEVCGYGHNDQVLTCKVLGYHWKYATVLVYNPKIEGHSGLGNTVNQENKKVSEDYMLTNYEGSCWYISEDDIWS